MNPGGEPERDESGLPPVDIEIPDDARELDRDMQAYYRELRAERRQQRGLRVRGTLAKDGIVLPLLACCLILALITGTLLTVFTATSDQTPVGLPGAANQMPRTPAASHAPSGGPSSTSSSPANAGGATPVPRQPGTEPGVLPPATISINGQSPVPVRDLRQAALVLIPSHCNCTATVSWLIHVVAGANAQTYLIYSASTNADVTQLYGALSRANQADVLLALERDTALRTSIPGQLDTDGLAAVLIGPKKGVTYATGLSPDDDPTSLIHVLTH